jgi:tRNA pseudouridine38-40 synthase
LPTWKLILEYDGTRYSGWQEQKNARTIEGELKDASNRIVGEAEVDGAGRTDAGVHAIAQVARLKGKRAMNPGELHRALNQELPKDINIIRVDALTHPFHPRHDALLRYYLYQISTRRSAFAKPYMWWIKEPLNLEALQAASSLLVGRHDFERFSDKRSEEKSTIVVVERVELDRVGDLILLRIGASHFLWKMVRRIVGCLAEVGYGRLKTDDFEALFSSSPLPQRLNKFSVAACTAPASGLFLERVIYDDSEDIGPLIPAFPIPSFEKPLRHGSHEEL